MIAPFVGATWFRPSGCPARAACRGSRRPRKTPGNH